MDILQKTLLETLKEFHDFCEKHNLQYFLIGGSLLGAVRHKGFIPWDDDIDVVMPREDFNQLLQLSSQLKYPLLLRGPKLQKDHRYNLTKLTNESLFIEEDAYKPITIGAWIDIFPLDYTFNSKYLQTLHFFIRRRIATLTPLKYDVMDIEKLSPLKRPIACLMKYVSKKTSRKTIEYLLDLSYKIPNNMLKKPTYLANLGGAWGVKEVAPIKVFLSRKLYKFETYYFWGPEDADYWLTRVYGDYMKLPPENKRQSHHNIKILKSK